MKNRRKKRKMSDIAVVCTINKICAGENTSRDTSISKELQEPQPHDICAGEISSGEMNLHRNLDLVVHLTLLEFKHTLEQPKAVGYSLI